MKENVVEPEYFKHSYTVGELLDYIEKHKIPREGKIFIQRIEDRYFDGWSKAKGWSKVIRPDFMHHVTLDKLADIRANRDQYPKITEQYIEAMQKEIDEQVHFSEYIPIHSPVGYDEYKHLFLDAHY